jgi:hypothetical protein
MARAKSRRALLGEGPDWKPTSSEKASAKERKALAADVEALALNRFRLSRAADH